MSVKLSWKKAGVTVALGGSTFELGGLLLERFMAPHTPVPVNLGDLKVSIHCPTINEEPWISETLESIVNQPLYREGAIKLVVLDSYSTDGTREVAGRYTSNVWLVPRGKLFARDEGIKKDDADIVVSVDAGDRYPLGWLSRLLKPFEDPDVVATHGPVLSKDWLWKAPNAWFNLIRPNYSISARNSALKTKAYERTGGFNLGIDQLSRKAMVQEEERNFLYRLRQVGKVRYIMRAGMYATQRHMPFTLEDGRVPDYALEREKGIRF